MAGKAVLLCQFLLSAPFSQKDAKPSSRSGQEGGSDGLPDPTRVAGGISPLVKRSVRLKSQFPPQTELRPSLRPHPPGHNPETAPAASAPLRGRWPLPFQAREPLLVSSSVRSRRLGNSSVVCSRIYLQAARVQGKEVSKTLNF